MSGATVAIDVREISALRDLLNSKALTSSDRRKLLSSIGTEMIEQTRERITKTKEEPSGKPWEDFAESTLKSLDKHGLLSSVSLLHREGYLHESLTREVKSEWAVLVGATMEYAATHQLGAKQGEFGRTKNNVPIPWGDIPARPYLGLSSADVADLVAMTGSYLRNKMA